MQMYNGVPMRTSFAFALSICAFVLAQESDLNKRTEEELLRIERDWSRASEKHDKAQLAAIVADDFIWVPQSGEVVGKEEYVNTTGAPNRSLGGSQPEEARIRVYGDTALVLMKRRVRFMVDGTVTERHVRMTDTFVKRNGQWKAVHRQVTRIADAVR